MSDHRARYKNTALDARELRRRREENTVKLRKQKREDVFSKKRQATLKLDSSFDDHDDALIEDKESSPNETTQDLTLTPEIIASIMQHNDMMLLLQNAQTVRKILANIPDPPFDDVIKSGLVPRLVQLLDLDENSLIQFEVAWILTNICSGTTEQCRTVINSGALPKLVRLLRSPDMRVCEQAIWALGNIIGDCAEFRDMVLSHEFLPALLVLLSPDLEIGFLRNVTWVIVNLCRNKDPPTSMDVIRQLIPALTLLVGSLDKLVLIDTTWAISYICELGPTYSQLIIDSGLVEKLAHLLNHSETKIQTAAIRAIGCITTGSDDQTQVVIDAGVVPYLRKLLEENNDKVVKDALWLISNITAGSHQQIQAVIDSGIIPMVIHYLDVGNYQQQKEASWTIFNYCLSGSDDQLRYLVDVRVIPALSNLLQIKDNNLVKNILDALSCILRVYQKAGDNTARDQLEACDGLDKIESLQNSENEEIYVCACSMIEDYFSTED